MDSGIAVLDERGEIVARTGEAIRGGGGVLAAEGEGRRYARALTGDPDDFDVCKGPYWMVGASVRRTAFGHALSKAPVNLFTRSVTLVMREFYRVSPPDPPICRGKESESGPVAGPGFIV